MTLFLSNHQRSFLASAILADVEVLDRHWNNSIVGKSNSVNVLCTIGVNVLVTLMICIRLLSIPQKAYTAVITIMIESALLFTAAGILFFILSWLGSSTAEGMLLIWVILGVGCLLEYSCALGFDSSCIPLGNLSSANHPSPCSWPPFILSPNKEKTGSKQSSLSGSHDN
jgi:hypothetical protein